MIIIVVAGAELPEFGTQNPVSTVQSFETYVDKKRCAGYWSGAPLPCVCVDEEFIPRGFRG